MANTSKPALSTVAQEILDFLKEQENGMTLAEIKTQMPNANPSHLKALRTRDLVDADEVEVEVTVVKKTKVLKYVVKAEA